MSRYRNLHWEKPEVNQLVYWMGPNAKDILGWFRGNLQFQEVEKKYPGYIPKWWYPADEITIREHPDPLLNDEVIGKPKKERKQKIEKEIVQKEETFSGDFF